MAAGDVGEERAVGGRGRRWRQQLAAALGRREAPGEEPDRGRFHVALAAGDLAGEAQPRRGFEPQGRVEEFWRVEERVAVEPPKAGKFGLGKARNGSEDAHLLAVL